MFTVMAAPVGLVNESIHRAPGRLGSTRMRRVVWMFAGRPTSTNSLPSVVMVELVGENPLPLTDITIALLKAFLVPRLT